MDENGIQGLVISLAIGIALLAACGVVTFTLVMLGVIVL
jgi:hypothetical protein